MSGCNATIAIYLEILSSGIASVTLKPSRALLTHRYPYTGCWKGSVDIALEPFQALTVAARCAAIIQAGPCLGREPP